MSLEIFIWSTSPTSTSFPPVCFCPGLDLKWGCVLSLPPTSCSSRSHNPSHLHLAQQTFVTSVIQKYLHVSAPRLLASLIDFFFRPSFFRPSMAFRICPWRKTLTSALTALYLNFCSIHFTWVRKLQTTYSLTDSLDLYLSFLHLFTHSLLSLTSSTKDSHNLGSLQYITSHLLPRG